MFQPVSSERNHQVADETGCSGNLFEVKTIYIYIYNIYIYIYIYILYIYIYIYIYINIYI